MKKIITLAIASLLTISADAQRVGRSTYDDVYPECGRHYDKIEEVYDDVSNKLVVHKKRENVYHVYGEVEEVHYDACGNYVGRSVRKGTPVVRTTVVPTRRVVQTTRVVQPRTYSYEPVEQYGKTQYSCLGDNDDKWFFFFQFNSDYLTNREELGHLIDYAVSNPYANLYIDAYADADTGTYETNMNISRARANRIIEVLINEGINRKRLFVNCHGSISQPYNTNNLNRCVTVSTTAK